VLPVVAEMNAYRVRYLEQVRDLLLEPWPSRRRGRADLQRAVGHALAFGTWQSLVRGQGSTSEEAARLMTRFVGGLAGQSA
jgi:hypothetical protein